MPGLLAKAGIFLPVFTQTQGNENSANEKNLVMRLDRINSVRQIATSSF